MTRADWAKRPLAERVKGIVGAWERVAKWQQDEKEPLTPNAFALDLPDTSAPAPDARVDLMPSLTAAAILVASTSEERTVQEIVKCARALRDAATGGSNG